MNNDLYFAPWEAAQLLGISRERLSFLLREGRLPGASKQSGCWKIPRQALLTPIVAKWKDREIGTPPAPDVTPTVRKRGRPRRVA
jgi:Helix-turn-helix domain